MTQWYKQPFMLWGVIFPAGGAALALLAAYASEWFLGFHPCEMCLWQRIPYALIMALATLCFALKGRRANVFVVCIGILLGVEVGLAFYHAGVEWRWWEGMTACSMGFGKGQSIQDMLQRILEAPTVSCAEPPFRFLGLSMAGWNGVYALGLLLAMGYGWQKWSMKSLMVSKNADGVRQ